MNCRLLIIALATTVASACGWFEPLAEPQPMPAPDPGPQNTETFDPTDDSDSGENNSGDPTDDPDSAPDEPVTQPTELFTEPLPERCTNREFGRCEIAPSRMEPAPASRLASANVSPRQAVDCSLEDAQEHSDGLRCMFQVLETDLGADPVAASDFTTSFVYELYDDDGAQRLEVFQIDREGIVRPSSLFNDSRSHWGFDTVAIQGDRVLASDGIVLMTTTYMGFPLDLIVRDATFEGRLDPENPGLLLDGQIRGVVHQMDIHASLNNTASACVGEAIEPFTSDINASHCGDSRRIRDGGFPSCRALADICVLFTVLHVLNDVDLNDDGLPDAFSARFDVQFEQGERRYE
jgi:hypothetical protein